ncbi:hypothetical protein BS47DRAFT_1346335 [Hydnum rufescens UP504]|uniref:Uncharacterized protein n=1 Tax=Hydnum rufescens UP504 TaxID=1448309 RepID=A0A9P6ATM4_9AGAM|nr:hypothetical protein BS47DRAFT_1346335 [Hydnum rufescens UP504]
MVSRGSLINSTPLTPSMQMDEYFHGTQKPSLRPQVFVTVILNGPQNPSTYTRTDPERDLRGHFVLGAVSL